MERIEAHSERPNEFLQRVTVRSHSLWADVAVEEGGADGGPNPHDYFDTALVACKTLTANWYARKYKMALERVEARVTRDASQERAGRYVLTVQIAFHGALSPDEQTRLHAAVAKCPLHKLMTTADVVIETEPFVP